MGLVKIPDNEKQNLFKERHNANCDVLAAAISGKVNTATGQSLMSAAEHDKLANTYTKTETDNAISAATRGVQWKEAVATYADIFTTYPNPADGWVVNVNDMDYTYRFDGENWIPISANAIPIATPDLDGKMSKEAAAKLSVAITSDGSITGMAAITQAQYNALTPGATTLYVIVG
jgi:hypothetical protein